MKTKWEIERDMNLSDKNIEKNPPMLLNLQSLLVPGIFIRKKKKKTLVCNRMASQWVIWRTIWVRKRKNLLWVCIVWPINKLYLSLFLMWLIRVTDRRERGFTLTWWTTKACLRMYLSILWIESCQRMVSQVVISVFGSGI